MDNMARNNGLAPGSCGVAAILPGVELRGSSQVRQLSLPTTRSQRRFRTKTRVRVSSGDRCWAIWRSPPVGIELSTQSGAEGPETPSIQGDGRGAMAELLYEDETELRARKGALPTTCRETSGGPEGCGEQHGCRPGWCDASPCRWWTKQCSEYGRCYHRPEHRQPVCCLGRRGRTRLGRCTEQSDVGCTTRTGYATTTCSGRSKDTWTRPDDGSGAYGAADGADSGFLCHDGRPAPCFSGSLYGYEPLASGPYRASFGSSGRRACGKCLACCSRFDSDPCEPQGRFASHRTARPRETQSSHVGGAATIWDQGRKQEAAGGNHAIRASRQVGGKASCCQGDYAFWWLRSWSRNCRSYGSFGPTPHQHSSGRRGGDRTTGPRPSGRGRQPLLRHLCHSLPGQFPETRRLVRTSLMTSCGWKSMAISLVGHDESLGNCSEDAADGPLCCTDRFENFPFLRQQQTARGVKAPSQHFPLPVNSGCSSGSPFHLLHHPLSCEAPFPLQWDLASKGHHCLLPHFCLGCECLQASTLHTKSCFAGCLCRALKKRIGSPGSFAGRHSTSVGSCEPFDGDFPPPFHSIQVPNTRIGGAGAWTCFRSIFPGRVLPFGRFPLGPLVLGFFALACLIASEAAMPECYAGVQILSQGLRWFNYLRTDSCNISCAETLQHFFISCLCIWLALRALLMFDVSWVEQQAASAGILFLLALTWVLLRLLFPRKQHHLSNAARLCREPAEGFLFLPGLFCYTDRRPLAPCSCRRRTRRAKVRGGRHCHPQGLTTRLSRFLPFWTVPCFTTHSPAFGAGFPLVAYSFAFATGADAMAAPFEDVLEPDVLPDIARRPHHVMVET